MRSPEHVIRTSARVHICAVVFGGAPCVPRSREHENRPAAGRQKNADVQKKHVYTFTIICIYMQATGQTNGIMHGFRCTHGREHLSKRVMFGEIVGGKGYIQYSQGQYKTGCYLICTG